MGKGATAARPALPITLPSRGGVAANMPEEVFGLAGALAGLASNTPGLSVRRGTLNMRACSDCGTDVLPGLSGHGSFLENHLFAAQAVDRSSLIVFVSDRVLGALDALPASAAAQRVRRDLLDPAVRSLALEDASGEWLVLSGWNYSAPHRHDGKNTVERESYLTHDPSQGIRFAFSTASAFARVAGRPGLLAVADLDGLRPVSA